MGAGERRLDQPVNEALSRFAQIDGSWPGQGLQTRGEVHRVAERVVAALSPRIWVTTARPELTPMRHLRSLKSPLTAYLIFARKLLRRINAKVYQRARC